MSTNLAVDHVARARSWARDLEHREAVRSGEPIHKARQSLASRLGIPAGSLETLRKGRTKSVTATLYDKLCQAVEREIAAEIRRLEHELLFVRAQSLGADSPKVAKITALLDEARALLREGAV